MLSYICSVELIINPGSEPISGDGVREPREAPRTLAKTPKLEKVSIGGTESGKSVARLDLINQSVDCFIICLVATYFFQAPFSLKEVRDLALA